MTFEGNKRHTSHWSIKLFSMQARWHNNDWLGNSQYISPTQSYDNMTVIQIRSPEHSGFFEKKKK
jgi:hypothetical protein